MRHAPALRVRGFLLSATYLLVVFCCLSNAANAVQAQSLAYVTRNEDSVSVINTDSNTVIATIPVGNDPAGLAITPDGTRVYVTNQVDHTVSVIDTATQTVIVTIPVGSDTGGGFPQDIAITPDGTRAYVANQDGATISVIDIATNSVITAVPVGFMVKDVAITPDGTRAYATGEQGSNFAVIVLDTATNTVSTTIPLPGSPFNIAISPAARRPQTKDECKNGGWRSFGPPAGPFKNQGQCVSFVERRSGRE